MILWKVSVFILGIVFYCAAENDNVDIKNKVVRDIIQKVYNLIAESLTKASPSERNTILKNIETQLKRSAEPFGNKADKYVHFVMQGLKALAGNNSIVQGIRKQANILRNSDNTEEIKRKASDLNVDEIANKIFNVAKKHVDNAKTVQEKESIIENIKNKVLETAKKQHIKIHNKHDEIKTYTDLITRGMELMMKKIDQSKRRTDLKPDHEIKNINSDVSLQEINILNKTNIQPAVQGGQIDHIVMRANEQLEITIPESYVSTPLASCDVLVIDTCTDIKSLNRYTCPGKSKTLALSKLCDGNADCPEGVDEIKCIDQAMARMHRATRVMSLIERYLLRKCFLTSDSSILVRQNTVLNDVLHRQIKFLQKYSNTDSLEERLDSKSIKETIHDVVIVINTLTVALDGSLCSEAMLDKTEVETLTRTNFPIIEEDVVKTKEPLEICDCIGLTCAGLSCPEPCKLVCWYKYNLVRWVCQAVDEGTSVPLDVVCDGKMDCYDETDELGCTTGESKNKFEANEMFDIVLKTIKTKSASKQYLPAQTKLRSLYNCVSMLQKATLKPKIDVASVRLHRNNCFSSLLTIYEDIAKTATLIEDLDGAHLFLMSINEKLVSALKHSHTGNDKILARNGCYCRGTRCIVPQCSNGCKRACMVLPKLTKYQCKGTPRSNISIPIDWICNKRPDCPFEDDEAQCVNDVCRKHHLILLRQSLRQVGDSKRGTSVGESLKTWKTKVTATLMAAESNYRPTPTTLRDVVRDILNDLAMSYASLENAHYRRTNSDSSLKEFLKVSQKVMDSLRSCDQ